VDVDYFKKYNDNYGHPEGDRCLALLGNSLRESLTRDNQLVARYGGEEFALILPDTDIQEALRRRRLFAMCSPANRACF
jgi:diguanylate cyclase (GGDEF)-like protein